MTKQETVLLMTTHRKPGRAEASKPRGRRRLEQGQSESQKQPRVAYTRASGSPTLRFSVEMIQKETEPPVIIPGIVYCILRQIKHGCKEQPFECERVLLSMSQHLLVDGYGSYLVYLSMVLYGKYNLISMLKGEDREINLAVFLQRRSPKPTTPSHLRIPTEPLDGYMIFS